MISLQRALSQHPHVGNACFAAIVGGAGDVGNQLYCGCPEEYEPGRTMRLAGYRLCVWGPLYSCFVRALDRIIGPAASAGAVTSKILADQLVWTPPSMTLFYMCMAVAEGGTVNAGWHRAMGESAWDGTLWKTLKINWPFWGTAHIVTYALVPLTYRVAFVSMVSIAWNGILSGLNQAARERSVFERELHSSP
eukprot:TRINITY_DN21992_c0_g1_i2.p1 TRINITY_DN21992_c0_g1~~TRINITY_DN21992_c0_g1_i2.p1  ORF type:complete len:193 (+),score=9.98 TRINITY_DN21992_c0_g1_i2:68-646(+)